MSDNVFVTIDYIKTVNYSLCHNHIPICRYIEIKNDSLNDIIDVQVKVSGKYILDNASPVYGLIRAEKSLKITNFEITLKADELFNITERIVSSFELDIIVGGETAYKKEFELGLIW